MKKTTIQFKNELEKIQPNLIVLGEYINTDTKILVADKLGIEYMSTPYKLLQNRVPSILSSVNKDKAFEILAVNVHGIKYVYTNSIYTDSYTYVNIICKDHGNFKIKPFKHLDGQGCSKCGHMKSGINSRSNSDIFVEKAIKKHGYTYDYSKVKYETAIKKVAIICKIHGEFKQQPNNHLTGQGCPTCGNKKISDSAKLNCYGWSFSNWENKIKNNNNTKPRLYILECNSNKEKFIKVGITMHDVKKRYPGKKQMPYDFKILKEIIDTPINIHNLEQKIKKNFKKYKFLPSLKFNGMYECYSDKCENEILTFV